MPCSFSSHPARISLPSSATKRFTKNAARYSGSALSMQCFIASVGINSQKGSGERSQWSETYWRNISRGTVTTAMNCRMRSSKTENDTGACRDDERLVSVVDSSYFLGQFLEAIHGGR